MTLEEEYQDRKAQWRAGERDRELGLQLLFLAWWHWAEPAFLTDMTDDPDADALWHELFSHFEGERSRDAEFLFVAGVMATIMPHVLGIDERWDARGLRMIERAMTVQATALPLSTFEDRGDYGEYFAHQLRSHLKRS